MSHICWAPIVTVSIVGAAPSSVTRQPTLRSSFFSSSKGHLPACNVVCLHRHGPSAARPRLHSHVACPAVSLRLHVLYRLQTLWTRPQASSLANQNSSTPPAFAGGATPQHQPQGYGASYGSSTLGASQQPPLQQQPSTNYGQQSASAGAYGPGAGERFGTEPPRFDLAHLALRLIMVRRCKPFHTSFTKGESILCPFICKHPLLGTRPLHDAPHTPTRDDTHAKCYLIHS